MVMNWQTARVTTELFQPLLKAKHVGIISDFDGTLSPIVADPNAATMSPRSRAVLQALAQQITLVALVSGRAVEDVRARAGLEGVIYSGNHGLERWQDGKVVVSPEVMHFQLLLEQVAGAVQEMAASDADLAGVQVEDKRYTISIHYRRTADPVRTAAILQPVLETLAYEHDLRLYSGRMVFELRPPLEINKGTIFTDLVTSYHLDAAVFIGDDTTDADALRAARVLRESGASYTLAVGVESEVTPSAVLDASDVVASGVSGVEALLEWLAEAFSALRASSS